ncbi:FixH family protein [Poseidonibacter ostreae]|uniref:YtkA-like domain-containing protein n=1 Tax=Poseidonibacter ostreae TaxID=2654171 RepID=A0A6L4WP25_9BACT|nr:FixH family protein [Poseidonibacter ostreae]KAB7884288.1 hypothetical protein GA417_12260 [Poseidonibacter ostreae]KAB7885271.1 hypothetical protein GBG19_14365 [Poseidonibacter ostreae]KAB7891974.1 hypothetical protein GBG18_05140 [Poseidonibacter ostreae]
MNRMLKVVIGLSLVASSSLYASGDHTGDHMHEGKMTNHMKDMDHETMNINHKKSNMSNSSLNLYHHTIVVDGYQTTISSIKPLKDGKNDMTISILKNKKDIKNAIVNIKFSMPSMPGMEFTENAGIKGNKYNTNINFSMHGEWAYELIFKTSDGLIHKTKNSVHIK